MADNVLNLTALSIQIASAGVGDDRKMTTVISFTANAATWEITMPDILHDEIRHLVKQFERAISRDQHAAGLTEGANFTVVLL